MYTLNHRLTLLKVPNVGARQGDPDLVHLRGGDLRASGIVLLLSLLPLGDVTHLEVVML